MSALAWMALGLALVPLVLTAVNLPLFRRPATPAPAGTRVSILIPARDEAATIEVAVRAALASEGVEVEVVVLDDQSIDGTADIVRRLAAADTRLRLEQAPPLPPGWSGKQRACALLADLASHDLLLFVDADVRLSPRAATLAAGHLLKDPRLGLVSAFPREETGSWAEHLAIPWIHALLLGYLPMIGMRWTRFAGFAAGCGQFMMARRDAYRAVGGHGAVPLTRHDGVTMPRLFRRLGWMTDAIDGHDLARCRMYRGFREVWAGFSKNAEEGLATPVGLYVWTFLIGGGHVLPWVLLPSAALAGDPEAAQVGAAACLVNLAQRLLLMWRFVQHPLAALSHPLSALFILAVNWSSRIARWRGRPASWRGRTYPVSSK